MLKSFFSHPNVLVRLLIVLIFAGGLIFAGTFDGFVPKTESESCGGETDIACSNGTGGRPEISLVNIEEIDQPISTQSSNCCNRW